MGANRGKPSMLRTPAIIKETGNEDRAVDSETPKVGMIFDTFEDAKQFYKKYADAKGFVITTRSTKCGNDGKLKYYTVSCLLAGKPVGSKNSRPLSKRSSRTDCKARINIKGCKDGRFRLSGFTSEHNHDLSPVSLENNRCNVGTDPEIRVESDERLETQVNNNFPLTTGIDNVSSGHEERIANTARSESFRLQKLWNTCHHIIEIGVETEESFERAMKLLEEAKETMVKYKLESSGNAQDPASSPVQEEDEVQYSCELHRVLARIHKKRKARWLMEEPAGK